MSNTIKFPTFRRFGIGWKAWKKLEAKTKRKDIINAFLARRIIVLA